MKEPRSLLIPANKIGKFSCEALCDEFECSGFWVINGTRHDIVSMPEMNSTYQSGNENNILTLTVSASETMNGTSIQCKYEADGNMDGFNRSATVYLLIISSTRYIILIYSHILRLNHFFTCMHGYQIYNLTVGPSILSNPSVFKNATHATLKWSPPFLWPGERIHQYNVSVTNKNDESISHHLINTSFTDPIVSFSMSSTSLPCNGIMFSISPVTELTQTFNISDWIWSVFNLSGISHEIIVIV